MNKTVKKIALLLFCLCAVTLFQACESDFLQSASEKLIPEVLKSPLMTWDSTKIYINPQSYGIDGMMSMAAMSGQLSDTTKNVWFKSTAFTEGNEWILSDSNGNDEIVNSVAAIIGNPGSLSTGGNQSRAITLNFGTVASYIESFAGTLETGSFVPHQLFTEGLSLSFILTPRAFTGPDSGLLVTDSLVHNFTLVIPTYAEYAKQAIEKFEYGSIAVSSKDLASKWDDYEHEGGEAGSISLMKELAGSIAVGKVNDRLDSFFKGGSVVVDKVDSWKPLPDTGIEDVIYGSQADQQDYTLGIEFFSYEDDDYFSTKISIPVEFNNK
jgi:hypothetical protein